MKTACFVARWFFALLCCLSSLCAAFDDLSAVHIDGTVESGNDLSALGVAGDYLVIGSDETSSVQILKGTNEGYRVKRSVSLARSDAGAEMDIEAIAVDGDTIYVIGSHAKVRPRVKASESQTANRQRLASVPARNTEFRARNTLARFTLDRDGAPSKPQFSSLSDLLDRMQPFKQFRALASKENGVDIEGLAYKDGKLYAGFRAPVLRGNFVPVLVFSFKQPNKNAQVRYLNLCGRGVRDLASVEGGFLVLAGPPGEGPGMYQIYFWDGRDSVPGAGPPESAPRLLAELPMRSEPSAKAEGIAVLGADAQSYELILAFDGVKDGGMRRVRLSNAGIEGQRCAAD